MWKRKKKERQVGFWLVGECEQPAWRYNLLHFGSFKRTVHLKNHEFHPQILNCNLFPFLRFLLHFTQHNTKFPYLFVVWMQLNSVLVAVCFFSRLAAQETTTKQGSIVISLSWERRQFLQALSIRSELSETCCGRGEFSWSFCFTWMRTELEFR